MTRRGVRVSEITHKKYPKPVKRDPVTGEVIKRGKNAFYEESKAVSKEERKNLQNEILKEIENLPVEERVRRLEELRKDYKTAFDLRGLFQADMQGATREEKQEMKRAFKLFNKAAAEEAEKFRNFLSSQIRFEKQALEASERVTPVKGSLSEEDLQPRLTERLASRKEKVLQWMKRSKASDSNQGVQKRSFENPLTKAEMKKKQAVKKASPLLDTAVENRLIKNVIVETFALPKNASSKEIKKFLTSEEFIDKNLTRYRSLKDPKNKGTARLLRDIQRFLNEEI